MGWTSSGYGGEERCIWGFVGETLRDGDNSEDPDVDERILLKGSSRGWMGGHGQDQSG
jgi:hypothetical protein